MLTPLAPRLGLLLAAGALIAVAGAVIVTSGRNDPDDPAIVPPSSVAPAPPDPTASAPAVVPLPEALRATWVADVGEIEGLLDADPRIELIGSPAGDRLYLVTNEFGDETMFTAATATSTGEVTLVATADRTSCTTGDVGLYRYAVAGYGLTLTFEPVEDACATRSEILGRVWYRSLQAVTDGGRGVLPALTPAIVVTLPEANFRGTDWSRSSTKVASSTLVQWLTAIQQPWGVPDPCAGNGGVAGSGGTAIGDGGAAAIAYLESIPGLTVSTESLEIGGYLATHLTVTPGGEGGCPGQTTLFTAKDVTSGLTLGVAPSEVGSFWVIDHPSGAVLVQYAGLGLTKAAEREVIESIAFLESL